MSGASRARPRPPSSRETSERARELRDRDSGEGGGGRVGDTRAKKFASGSRRVFLSVTSFKDLIHPIH